MKPAGRVPISIPDNPLGQIQRGLPLSVRPELDVTTSHSTRLPKDASQVAGYVGGNVSTVHAVRQARHERPNGLSGLILVLFCLVRPAWADIYAYSADDGTLNLSNVPSDSRYTILYPSHREAALAPPSIIKPPSKFSNKEQYNQIVAEVAHTYGLDSALLHAVISVESRYIPNAVSRKGAAGLMQLMPKTAERYGVADSFDPVQNLHGGAKYLRDLLRTFNNDLKLVLAAYNAGESAVMKYGNRIPPFRETENYVPRVLSFYRRYQSEPG